jgi:hypothetical protein
MRPFPAELMQMWPISTRVNKPENPPPGDAAKVVESIDATADKAEAERIATMLAAKYGLDDDLDEHRTGLPQDVPQDDPVEPPAEKGPANPSRNP